MKKDVRKILKEKLGEIKGAKEKIKGHYDDIEVIRKFFHELDVETDGVVLEVEDVLDLLNEVFWDLQHANRILTTVTETVKSWDED